MSKSSMKIIEPVRAQNEDSYYQAYSELVRKTQLADYSDVHGCMVIRPYGCALWENIRNGLDRRMKAAGVQNTYFPMLIPESFLQREAAHVAGFGPEAAWVTQIGEDTLQERLAIRPTSEAVVSASMAKWVQSYRDLPVKINQWANAMRWEHRPRMFIRTNEFLWQEGHSAHRTEHEALGQAHQMLDLYYDFLREELALASVAGLKTEHEKFAGALETFSLEGLAGDGCALQLGTSHFLGQRFAQAFGIKFQDEDNSEQFAWQSSWGVSSRLIGALVMAHADAGGLRLPPRVAPVQAVVIPIGRASQKRAQVLEMTHCAVDELAAAGVRAQADTRDWQTTGFKFNEWEQRGVPLRVEIGPREQEHGTVSLVARTGGERLEVPMQELSAQAARMLEQMQTGLLNENSGRLAELTTTVSDYGQFQEIVENKGGFVAAGWDGTDQSEAIIRQETKATIRCIPLRGGQAEQGLRDIRSGRPARHRVLFARAY